jgi:hypothetical protein
MKQIKKETPVDFYILLFCAFRYALGRHSYVASSIAQTLINNYGIMEQLERDKYIKEIDEWYYGNIKEAQRDISNTTWWLKVMALFSASNRIKVKAYCPLKAGAFLLKHGEPMPLVEIDKKIKPEIHNAVVFETLDGKVEYWTANMNSAFYYAEPIEGSSW